MKLKVAESAGINWTWFKVQNGNLVAIFRLHYGEQLISDFRRAEKKMTKVEDIKVPWATWREECDLIADHTTRLEGYARPEVEETFSWLAALFKGAAGQFELDQCEKSVMHHLWYHGVAICRVNK